MATLIGDVFTDSSRFHTMIGGAGLQHQHSHQPHYHSRSVSRSRDRDAPSHHHQHHARSASPRKQGSTASASTRHPSQSSRDWEEAAPDPTARDTQTTRQIPTSSGGASRFPSPPSSSSPSDTCSGGVRPQHGIPAYVQALARDSAAGSTSSSSSSTSSASSTSTAATVVAAATRTIPSPDSDGGPTWDESISRAQSSSNIPASLSMDDRPASPIPTQTTIRIRDLAHVQSLTRAGVIPASRGTLNDPPLQQMKYEISGMPINDIIEMVAALLTDITTKNDARHDALNRNAAHIKQAQAQAKGDDGSLDSNMSPLSSSVLAFHGKNVPAITILSYLSRIHKYCPTTYEVFLSLLVYFDRMMERVNAMVEQSQPELQQRNDRAEAGQAQQSGNVGSIASTQPAAAHADADTVMHDDESEDSDETDSDLADDDDHDGPGHDGTPTIRIRRRHSSRGSSAAAAAAPHRAAESTSSASVSIAPAPAQYFVVDSFNIHRLIIAGVTCASKFFSDVFYTNSRYAKVGGLPLAELNHLELQFLLLNDFRLAVPVEDLEAYATMLVEFYAGRVLGQRSRPTAATNNMD
ncbi:cyclin-domain-containing protein [Diplogelasinospora grovesii]|uniref:Cyclin-domain-containing protein n=1 Tax=Diplogelasinospora grovesii TaxID=303347 RepID=A0AAN6S562_9PEZI|nr:cyclin-domain-containing protein [Diplogelasinospora grovesii]